MAVILIVEDDKDLHAAYKTILEKEGYKVLSAFNGKEALEITKNSSIDIILLDLHMPEMNGLAFLRQFEAKKSKVVIFTNMDAKKDIDAAQQLGADRYILKAWASPQELVRVVKDTLQTK